METNEKKILAAALAVLMAGLSPAGAVLGADEENLTVIVASDSVLSDQSAAVSDEESDDSEAADSEVSTVSTEAADSTASASSTGANSADMLDDDDMFVDADSSDMGTDEGADHSDTEADSDETGAGDTDTGSTATDETGAGDTDTGSIAIDETGTGNTDTSDTDTATDKTGTDNTDAETDAEAGTDIEAETDESDQASFAATASGTCGADSSDLTWELCDGVLTISGTGAMKSYSVNTTSVSDASSNPPWFSYRDEITSVIIESGVTSIGSYAFMHCTALTSISIPDTVTSIGARSFFECTALTSLTIPDSVTTIGSNTFVYCSSLTSITLSANLTAITQCMLAGCSSLTSVVIPASVTSIGVSAFSSCVSLTSLTIPASVTSIDVTAFSECPALASITVDADNTAYSSADGVLFNKEKTELILYPAGKTGDSYSIPSGVTTIGESAFCGCALISITIPDTVTNIGEFAFESCTGLQTVIVPDSVTVLGSGAFYDCEGLVSISIGSGVTALESCMFEYCESLTEISLPSGLTAIGEKAFYKCTSLVSLSLPAGVAAIGEYAFYKCTGLSAVYYQGTKTQWASVSVEAYNDPFTEAEVYYSLSTCAITLSASSYTYNGSAKCPAPTITDGSTALTRGTDYSYTEASYYNNVNAGTASLTITGAGEYSGSTAVVYFTIQKASQSVTASAAASSVAAGSTTSITAAGIGTLTYSSSQSSVASVSSKGVVTGKKPGTVTITVTAAGNANYASASATVTVKVTLAKGSVTSLTNKASGIVVRWSKITGASGYYVYRKTTTGGYSRIATVKSGSVVKYVDTNVKSMNGVSYTYKVIAYYGTVTNSCTSMKTVRLTRPSLSKAVSTRSGRMTVKWKAVSGVTGYQIQYSTSASFSSAKSVWVKSAAKSSRTISSLTKGKKYYVRIRTYAKTSSGTKYYSAWSSTKSVKIKK